MGKLCDCVIFFKNKQTAFSQLRSKIDLKFPSDYLHTITRRYFCCGSVLPVFVVSFGDVSPYLCTDYFSSG